MLTLGPFMHFQAENIMYLILFVYKVRKEESSKRSFALAVSISFTDQSNQA